MSAVIITGGRNHPRFRSLYEIPYLDQLQELLNIDLVYHGDAPGADTEAARWANSRRLRVIAVPADWEQFGKAAGPRRNAEMLYALMHSEQRAVIAFPGGKGTQNMIGQANKEGVRVYIYRPRTPVKPVITYHLL